MEVLFALAADSPTGAVLEANFHRTLAVPSILGLPGRTLEVFCRCDREVARRRYRARAGGRDPGHFDAARSDEEIWHDEVNRPVAGGWPSSRWTRTDRSRWKSCWAASETCGAGRGPARQGIRRRRLAQWAGGDELLRRAHRRQLRRRFDRHVRPGGRRRDGRVPRRVGRGRRSTGAGHRDGPHRAPAVPARGTGAGDRPLARHGGPAEGETRIRGDRRHARELRHHPGRRDLPARLPGVQHDREPDHPGRAGGVLLQRGGAPRAGWLLRDRGGGAPDPAVAPGRQRPCLHGQHRPGWGSTSSMSPGKRESRTTTGSTRAAPRPSPCRTATCGPPSSISWRASPACACASAGAAGAASRSRPRAAHTCRFGSDRVARVRPRSDMLLVLVTGLPGTGKSTMAEIASRELGAPVLGHDWAMSGLRPYPEMQRALDAMDPPGHRGVGWSLLWALARSQLRRGSSVVLDGVARHARGPGHTPPGARGGRGRPRGHDHLCRRRHAPRRGSKGACATSPTGTSSTGSTSAGRGRPGHLPAVSISSWRRRSRWRKTPTGCVIAARS